MHQHFILNFQIVSAGQRTPVERKRINRGVLDGVLGDDVEGKRAAETVRIGGDVVSGLRFLLQLLSCGRALRIRLNAVRTEFVLAAHREPPTKIWPGAEAAPHRASLVLIRSYPSPCAQGRRSPRR